MKHGNLQRYAKRYMTTGILGILDFSIMSYDDLKLNIIQLSGSKISLINYPSMSIYLRHMNVVFCTIPQAVSRVPKMKRSEIILGHVLTGGLL